MKKHYETHVEDTDKLISVAGPVLDYKSWYEQYRKLMEEQAQRKYGLYTPTSEGNEDDFPSISGMIARYSALGLTNEQMAENPVWVDKTGNGHDLQMKNFSWGGMSGVGGYKFNFLSNEWVIDNNQVSKKYSYKIVINNKRNSVQLYNRINLGHIKITLKITGIEINKSTFRVYDNVGMEHAQDYTKDGIYEIDYTANEGANMIYFYVFGGNMGQLENPITIEQLPLYPGALVFDGVDDWAGCDNLPLLPKEKGYSIIALRNWITRYDATQYKRPLISNLDTNDEGAFLIEYRKDENVNDVTGSYNSFTDVYIDDNNPITWQTSSSYNGQIIKKGTSKSTNKLCICKTYFGKLSNYANAAIWEIVILDHDATEEELTKIKDYFVKTYPWLFPDQAWTVTGKTNEDEDRATIANITGNGNNLVLSNFGFAEGSGYGLYKLNFNNWFANSGSGNVNIVNPHKIVLEQSQEAVGAFFLGKNVSYSGELKISVSNKPSDIELSFGSSALGKVVLNEGINICKINPVNTSIGFFTNKAFEAQNIIIEQIPEYEGYLVTDGVDDKITSSTFEMGNDWTVIGDWELINTGKNDNAGIVKFDSIVIYNYNPILINIKNGRNILIPDQNTINAVCSDGRIYSKDWKESIYNEETESTSKNLLTIGYSGNNYTKLAFRNLAIYPTVLSKEDCIKAYNYLQTLKAK